MYLHLVLPGRENLYLSNGEVVVKQGIPFAFNNNDREDAVKFFYTDNQLQVFAPFEINKVDMASLTVEDRQSGIEIPQDTLLANKLHSVSIKNLISFLGQQIMINSIEKKSKFSKLHKTTIFHYFFSHKVSHFIFCPKNDGVLIIFSFLILRPSKKTQLLDS
mgnify:CR=1 FL=1